MNKLEPVIAFIDERIKQLERSKYSAEEMDGRIEELEMIRTLCQGLIKQNEMLADAMRPKSMYPPGWPQCTICGAPALDGHITCGLAQCDEGIARNALDR